VNNQRDVDTSTETARLQQAKYAVPEREFLAWVAHRDEADRRGVPFRFSLPAWRGWWMHQLTLLGTEARRGRNRQGYAMALIDPAGAYEHGNVRCVVVARPAAAEKCTARGAHLRVRGDGHPRSRAVITPDGRFGSIALAAEHHGLTRAAGSLRARERRAGWAFADEAGGMVADAAVAPWDGVRAP